ncbi:MAG: class I SAM-dependent methyltransferase [Verrucomicrobiales bacterium]|nr:class I SAM-dependent methyltransferase [Verrucomicrobiales bacterium]
MTRQISFFEDATETPDLPAPFARQKRVQSHAHPPNGVADAAAFARCIRDFRDFGKSTVEIPIQVTLPDQTTLCIPGFVNEYWTSAQRAASRLHEISYRACFKPQLPRFFVEHLTQPGERVYDPFMGRGTTLIEAALLGRVPMGCDINPLSVRLVRPRLDPPTLPEVAARLNEIDLKYSGELREDLLVFYHRETLEAITALKHYLLRREKTGTFDAVDDWIGMVALNRLTGHSPGFFSVYTLPPNQATSVASQIRINEKRQQVPPVRDVAAIILKKSKQLLAGLDASTRRTLAGVASKARLLTSNSSATSELRSGSVDLVVTSPPFLDVVQYAADNWLRCWFLGIDAHEVPITMTSRLSRWRETMTEVLKELHRVLKPGGYVAFEVGEVNGGKVKLEEHVIPAGVAAGLKPEFVLINDQEFTKTANCWGVDNNGKGTNTNRVVFLTKS